MPLAIEDYALIGDCHAAAMVGRNGSIDWLCLPRFDSDACFAALLGGPEHGHWQIAPTQGGAATKRSYRDGTLILETEFETPDGAVRIIDCMPLSNERWDVLRIVEGLRGSVAMHMELIIRFDYGSLVPWLQQMGDTLIAIGGPDRLELHTAVAINIEETCTSADFLINAGERIPFTLNYSPSHEPEQEPLDPESALQQTEDEWRRWSERCNFDGPWRPAVVRSLLTLKALTYAPTGGIVAAPTTSLPEQLGGVRNWDYRYCWLRDATFTLNALLLAGYTEEAVGWREWLLRAAAGSPDDLQILYSVTGKRRLDEYDISWLPGYLGSQPVRIGNAASTQFQLDVYGEVMDTLHLARAAGLAPEPAAWNIQVALLEFLESAWKKPDEGIWEVRGPRRHFTHSKVMAWVAFDRAIKDAETIGLAGPVARWREVRDAIHADVCANGFDTQRNAFVQFYGSSWLDASLLLIPQVGFLPPDDPRVLGTLKAIESDLIVDGLVLRYATSTEVDSLPAGEGAFLPCSFWLADAFVLSGRRSEALALFERLLALCNDVGLLAEEYDPHQRRMLGNFPQALTHMALINTARLLSISGKQVKRANEQGERPASAAQAPPTHGGAQSSPGNNPMDLG